VTQRHVALDRGDADAVMRCAPLPRAVVMVSLSLLSSVVMRASAGGDAPSFGRWSM
jgi:hypothetical protein